MNLDSLVANFGNAIAQIYIIILFPVTAAT